MMVKIVPFETEHAVNIIQRNNDEGIKQKTSVSVEEMIRSYTIPGSRAVTIMKDKTPIVCAGIINLGWKRGEAWLLKSSLFYKYKFSILKIGKRFIPLIAKEGSFRRVQSVSFTENNRWFECLGFKREGILEAYGPDGQSVIMYSRIFKENANG